jgi:hypothetical protein
LAFRIQHDELSSLGQDLEPAHGSIPFFQSAITMTMTTAQASTSTITTRTADSWAGVHCLGFCHYHYECHDAWWMDVDSHIVAPMLDLYWFGILQYLAPFAIHLLGVRVTI